MQQTIPMVMRPNRDQSLIKLVAVITMMVDHAGVIFFPGVNWLRIIGRIAFPLFCWGIVIGVERTRDWRKYALRLAILAVVTQPFFMLALNHTWMEFNVLATLLLGMLAIQAIRSKWYYSHLWGPIFCLLVAAAFRMDYGWRGVLLIILMHLTRNSRGGLAATMVAFCLYWGAGGSMVPRWFVNLFTQTPWQEVNRAFLELFGVFKMQSLAILGLPLMLVPTNSGLRWNKWLSYLAYPGHLALYWLIKLLLDSVS